MRLTNSRAFHAALLLTSFLLSQRAPAALISFSGTSNDGHAVSATVTVTPAVGTLTMVVTNTTATTLDSGELLTGINFNLGGLAATLTSKLGIERTVASDGSFVDTMSPQNLTWSLNPQGGGNYELNFTPDSSDSIIAAPSGSDYSGANGSIKGNNGHNPFTAVVGTFVFNVPGMTATSPVTITTFRYGTTLQPANGTIVPEPASLMLTVAGLALFMHARRKPRCA
jgi:hypothetical protein